LDDVQFVGTKADAWTCHTKAYIGVTVQWLNLRHVQGSMLYSHANELQDPTPMMFWQML
jgi:hypothetical protein